jgi:hypothetical protein
VDAGWEFHRFLIKSFVQWVGSESHYQVESCLKVEFMSVDSNYSGVRV